MASREVYREEWPWLSCFELFAVRELHAAAPALPGITSSIYFNEAIVCGGPIASAELVWACCTRCAMIPGCSRYLTSL